MNVLYCALAAAQEGLPGWHMFESAETLDVSLTDRDGPIAIRSYLPKNAWLVDGEELADIAAFICHQHPERAPYALDDRTVRPAKRRGRAKPRKLVADADCRFHAAE